MTKLELILSITFISRGNDKAYPVLKLRDFHLTQFHLHEVLTIELKMIPIIQNVVFCSNDKVLENEKK